MITRKEMTRMLLKEGLLSCLANHSFESVTVTLLCKASGITRSTFYLHYSNIMEIVDDLVDDAISYSRPGMVDNNNLQIDGTIEEVKGLEHIEEKFESFGFNVITVNGNKIADLIQALDKAKTTKGKPTAIVAITTKGKGVSFMENQASWHGKAPNEEQYKQAMEELQ